MRSQCIALRYFYQGDTRPSLTFLVLDSSTQFLWTLSRRILRQFCRGDLRDYECSSSRALALLGVRL